jgi:putative isomerase
MYAPEVESNNPSNWLGPVWLINNYIAYSGLKNYGFHSLADELAQRSIALLESDLRSSGTLHENYHPDTGRPNRNSGFVSWNALAIEMAVRPR